jgi:hypothetical protein
MRTGIDRRGAAGERKKTTFSLAAFPVKKRCKIDHCMLKAGTPIGGWQVWNAIFGSSPRCPNRKILAT